MNIPVGSNVRIFLVNGFKYDGKVQSADDGFVKILDERTGRERFLALNSVQNIEVRA